MSICFDNRRGKFRSALMLAAITMIGYAALLILFRNDPELVGTISNLLSPAANGLAAVGLLYAVFRSGICKRRIRIAWTLLFLGELSFILGDVTWTVLEMVLHQEPTPSAADVFYLMFYPLFSAGILLLPAVQLNRRENLKLLLNNGIVMISAALIFWSFIIEPTIAANNEDTMTLAVTLAYPVMDLVLFFALMQLLFRKISFAEKWPLLLLSLGIAV